MRAQRSLTASGERVNRRNASQQRRLLQAWQSSAFDYYDKLGEIHYASQFYSRMLSPLRLYAAEKDDNGDWVPTEDPEAIAALERIQDPGGGRRGLLADYGRLMFLAGECTLFVSLDEFDEERWEMLSTDELRIQEGMYYRRRAPQLGAEEYRFSGDQDNEEPTEDDWVPVEDKTAVAYRIWQRHPRYSALADSTMRGVLDICEELYLLTKAVRARTRSRLAGNGMLLIDERISPAPPMAAPDEDPAEDLWLVDLLETMMAPLEDEGSAAAMVPLLSRVTAPEGGTVADLVHHLQLVDPTQLYPETGLRYECVKRLAVGLDMPPEELTGLETANHWTAWMVDETTWKAHGQPKAQQFVDDVTQAYYRPYLRDVVGFAERAKNFMIMYDAADIINHPDRSKDAKDLHALMVIGDAALRDACGFDEDDAPTQDELNRMLGVAIRDGSLAIYGIPSIRGGTIEPRAGEVENPAGSSATDASGSTETSAGAKKGAPTPPAERNGNGNEVAALVARVIGAADLAQLRAREAAGNRLVSLAKRDPEMKAKLSGVRTSDVAAALGRDGCRKLHAPTARELAGGARVLVEDALRLNGITDDAILQAVADTVEQHAAQTLFDRHPKPLPDTFALYVTGLLIKAELPATSVRRSASGVADTRGAR